MYGTVPPESPSTLDRSALEEQACECYAIIAAQLAGLDPRPRDHLEDEAFEGALTEAQAKAEQIIASVHAGKVIRDPLGGSCPDFCAFQPICRRERGLPEDEPWSEEDEEE